MAILTKLNRVFKKFFSLCPNYIRFWEAKSREIARAIVCRTEVEEVPVKWMDRPSATEMERGHASEMYRQINCHTNGNATEMDNIF